MIGRTLRPASSGTLTKVQNSGRVLGGSVLRSIVGKMKTTSTGSARPKATQRDKPDASHSSSAAAQESNTGRPALRHGMSEARHLSHAQQQSQG